MLSKFSVRNFKGFKVEITFDLQNTHKYNFNNECIKDGLVNQALVYGYNGSGKSNLGLAIFDIIVHLTDKNRNTHLYTPYQHAQNTGDYTFFTYEFKLDNHHVVYKYGKIDYEVLIFEEFSIDGQVCVSLDRPKEEATVKLEGAENLKTNLTNPRLSLLKYILNNTELADNEINRCFKQFFHFVNHMLFFRSLHQNEYLGLEIGSRNIYADIIEQNQVKDFESFLHDAGINYKLCVVKESEEETIAVDFGGKKIALHLLASSGTQALSLFYYWLQRLQAAQVSFLFLDEFDAFYHHELSAFIVRRLKEMDIQSVITSHNTSIMSNDLLRPDCYFFLKNGKIHSLAKLTNKELREAHNIEKMYKAGTFDE